MGEKLASEANARYPFFPGFLVVVATVEAIVVIDLMMMTMMESRWKGNGLLLPPQLERIVTLL